MAALSKARFASGENPLERLAETERRLLEEIRDMRVAAELRRSNLTAAAQEIEGRVEQLASSIAVLPDALGGQDEHTVQALTNALQTLRADLRTYGLLVGGALGIAVVLLIVTIVALAR